MIVFIAIVIQKETSSNNVNTGHTEGGSVRKGRRRKEEEEEEEEKKQKKRRREEEEEQKKRREEAEEGLPKYIMRQQHMSPVRPLPALQWMTMTFSESRESQSAWGWGQRSWQGKN